MGDARRGPAPSPAMKERTMSTAARVGWVAVFALLSWSCTHRSVAPASLLPPPVVQPDGTQSLEDLDRALSSGGPALVATVHRSERTADKSAAVKVIVPGVGLVDPQLVG